MLARKGEGRWNSEIYSCRNIKRFQTHMTMNPIEIGSVYTEVHMEIGMHSGKSLLEIATTAVFVIAVFLYVRAYIFVLHV